MSKSAPPGEFQNAFTFSRIGLKCRGVVGRLTRASGATYPAGAARRARPTPSGVGRVFSAAAVRRGVGLETFRKFVSLSPGSAPYSGGREAFGYQGACR